MSQVTQSFNKERALRLNIKTQIFIHKQIIKEKLFHQKLWSRQKLRN
jgi:hypothetical protein